MSPTVPQIKSVTSIATAGGWWFAKRIAETTVDKAAREPTERSIPPVTMTKNWPTANTEVIEAAVMMLTRFRTARKYGETRAPITIMIAKTTNRYIFENTREISSPGLRSAVGTASDFCTFASIIWILILLSDGQLKRFRIASPW